MAMRERRKDHFGIGTKKKKNQRRRKEKGTCGKVEESRKVWEEICYLDQIGEREGEEAKKKKIKKREKEERKGKGGKTNRGEPCVREKGKEKISWCFEGRSSRVRELKLV